LFQLAKAANKRKNYSHGHKMLIYKYGTHQLFQGIIIDTV